MLILLLFIINNLFLIFRKALLLGIKTISDDDECPQLELQSDGTYRVSVYNTCNGLLKISDLWSEQLLTLTNWLAMILAFFTTAIPYLMLLTRQAEINAIVIVFYITNGIVIYFFSYVIFLFMATAIFDVMRQRNIFKAVRMMMRISDLHYYNHESTVAHNKASFKSLKNNSVSPKNNTNINKVFPISSSLNNVSSEVDSVTTYDNDTYAIDKPSLSTNKNNYMIDFSPISKNTSTSSSVSKTSDDSKTNLLHIKGESADRKRQRRTSATGHIVGMIIHE